MAQADIGVIGGSGFYQMEGLTDIEEVSIDTPFGAPSDQFLIGTLEGQRVAFLARHGRGHLLLPTELPFRANIYAMKLLGVRRIISASAVGSLQERYAPTDIVIPDQFFDRTRQRVSTFFGHGLVAHITFADPVCPVLGDVLQAAASEINGLKVHRGGTYLCMEGPAFSTKAESHVYRSWGMDVIGMTNLQEAKLAREAEICYSTMALVTDYDCWHPEHDSVTVEMVINYLNQNTANAQQLIRNAVRRLNDPQPPCKCQSSLKHAILTQRDKIPRETIEKLWAIVGKYFQE
ncbi:MAG: S-methyl-5'-thioadenosine phosphorylase [Acidobacteriota bacterium]|nr:S-methyl-5'-thioadenosine phosphorylase [Blastocatellia bacterium]MDW8239972.1 S-methyl-5'-thioadenosine phosphorylase [Acidobacteriota bacterium]